MHMTALASTVDPQSPDFARNAAAMKALVADLRAKLDEAMQGGSEEARTRHTSRGKLLPRERVDLLLDPGIAVPRILRARRARHVRRRRAVGRASSPASDG